MARDLNAIMNDVSVAIGKYDHLNAHASYKLNQARDYMKEKRNFGDRFMVMSLLDDLLRQPLTRELMHELEDCRRRLDGGSTTYVVATPATACVMMTPVTSSYVISPINNTIKFVPVHNCNCDMDMRLHHVVLQRAADDIAFRLHQGDCRRW